MTGKTSELILTAGPSITHKEIEYALDAVKNGWNLKMSDYLNRFIAVFSEYIGVKYALPTSSCTGALHLSLLGLGVGRGDEVIVPETTWIATASAVTYTGAIPVFADIDPATWVLDPEKVERNITKRTKAIIPVHLYGGPVDMDPLKAVAQKYGLKILEDAAPSIGTIYKGMKTGSIGTAGTFSFQGAKALVTGEGGMITTSDEDFYNKTKFIWSQCRDTRPGRSLCTVAIGYKYNMSNLTASLGTAQTERAEEIVARKRQIFSWYKERLGDIDKIVMNVERPDTRNIYWMTSIVLGKDAGIERDAFRDKMLERNIDTRSFFHPISSFPMFSEKSKENPAAYDVPLRGINLPSGHERTEEEIDYICAHIRDILDVKSPNKVSVKQPWGWLEFRDNVNNLLAEYKSAGSNEIEKYCLQLEAGRGRLRPVTRDSIDSPEEMRLLSVWREKVLYWFPATFKVTEEGTKKWAENGLYKLKDRILFYVDDASGRPRGHVGLYRFNYKEKFCELDNIVKGEDNAPKGIMTQACNTLLKWAFETAGIETAYLGVASDNERAIKLYERLGFREIKRIPLMKIQEAGGTRWIEAIGNAYYEVKRYNVTMKITKGEWGKKWQKQ